MKKFTAVSALLLTIISSPVHADLKSTEILGIDIGDTPDDAKFQVPKTDPSLALREGRVYQFPDGSEADAELIFHNRKDGYGDTLTVKFTGPASGSEAWYVGRETSWEMATSQNSKPGPSPDAMIAALIEKYGKPDHEKRGNPVTELAWFKGSPDKFVFNSIGKIEHTCHAAVKPVADCGKLVWAEISWRGEFVHGLKVFSIDNLNGVGAISVDNAHIEQLTRERDDRLKKQSAVPKL